MKRNIENRDVIILSSIDWSFMWQRHHEVATYFSKKNNVVYVETTAKRNPNFGDMKRIFNRLLKKKNVDGRNPLGENIKIVSPVALPPTSGLFISINNLYFINKIVSEIKEKCVYKEKKPIVITYLPTKTTIDITEKLNPEVLVYDVAYNFVHAENTMKSIKDSEKALLELADVIIADGLYHKREKGNLVNKEVQLVTNGVDVDVFYDELTKPRKKYSKLLYYGSISNKLDFDLIRMILDKNYELSMIGDWQLKNPFGDKYSNLHLMDAMPRTELVNYIREADAIIFPYKVNEFNKGVFPVKTFECLAAGKPLITTPFEDLLEMKSIYTANSKIEFMDILSDLHMLDSEDAIICRKETALKNSWQSKMMDIDDLICKKLM
ncbi:MULTISPECIES: glycosyltransferase [Bacillus cereus group]|uniref:glycosyltransferase n=1 Tax=Bacillus cereus group TaxID=86661 RepID=UPI001E5F27A4|nr:MULTISPECIES: glycosyltransferase [Bacillus cereus group]HDR7253090.1 hypothetical protein [Bacillus pacificus]MCC2399295.1 glycosyltransferase [Bacillus paranthracis]MCU5122628.1 glycosyltransferase [Bacillus paranthracis]MCU5368352.1 glycosyltransferase [Bacillus paranthracis]MCU5606952.1 glycosyltransferase [Bacillus paranthracis]